MEQQRDHHSGEEMTVPQMIIAFSLLTLGYMAAYNSAEAHRHTHELACAMEYQPLCIFHEVTK